MKKLFLEYLRAKKKMHAMIKSPTETNIFTRKMLYSVYFQI